MSTYLLGLQSCPQDQHGATASAASTMNTMTSSPNPPIGLYRRPHAGELSPQIAAVVPVLNEAELLETGLSVLWDMHGLAEIIVVDGGSSDDSRKITRDFANVTAASSAARHPKVVPLQSRTGRGVQMNAGAAATKMPILLFLHADTRLPRDCVSLIQNAFKRGFRWGRFDVRLDGAHFMLRVIERAMNIRSSITGIATGDQAIFTSRRLFQRVGGYPAIPLMEDIVLSKKLKRLEMPARIRTPVCTSARRWQARGTLRTVGEMWALRFMFWAGVAPERLAKWYYTSNP